MGEKMNKLKEDIVAMVLYCIAGLIFALYTLLYFGVSGFENTLLQGLSNVFLTTGYITIFFICLFLVAVGRIIDLLNQINQKLNK